MLLIYLDIHSPRVVYTLDFIFNSRGLTYELTWDLETFEQRQSSFRMAYCSNYTGKAFWAKPASIMEEIGLREQNVKKAEFRNLEVLSFDNQVDLIASIFYVLTRYEEYESKKHDQHGRFKFEDSILATDWVTTSVCDRWAEAIVQSIIPNWERAIAPVEIIPTFDIDNTFAYRLKKGFRMWVSLAKDVFLRNHERIRERKAVLLNTMKDPYDTFQKIIEIARSFPQTKVFWLVGKWGKKDRNISIEEPEHQLVINEVAEYATVGLHPSYASFLSKTLIAQEKKNLEKIVTKVTDSRQHFLRFRLPETFQELIKNGFNHEWSMGFAEHIGFRCGTARTHQWFDLQKNEETSLTIHPFVYMDGSLNEYMKLTPEESKGRIQLLFNEVQRYGGDFVFLWHNETIGEYGKWKGWSDVLNFTLNLNNGTE